MTWFRYSEKQRRQILEAIPPRDGEDRDSVVTALTASAAEVIALAHKPKSPYLGTVLKDLEKLKRKFEDLLPEAREAVNAVIGREFSEALEDAAHEVDVSDCLPRTGRRSNEAAITFVFRCRRIWKEHTGEDPPRRQGAEMHSPFYMFVKSAMPPQVHPPTTKGHNELTGVIRTALSRYHSISRYKHRDQTPA